MNLIDLNNGLQLDQPRNTKNLPLAPEAIRGDKFSNEACFAKFGLSDYQVDRACVLLANLHASAPGSSVFSKTLTSLA